MSSPLNQGNRWHYPKDGDEFHRVFAAAKEHGPQEVFDRGGVFTVTYSERGIEGSAKDFLTSGGPAEE